MAIVRAAWITGSVSKSWAPRSTASSSARPSSNGTRSSISGWTCRTLASIPLVGGAMDSVRPVQTADAGQPCGPTKSTTRRAPRVVVSVRLASFSISCQAAVETGASSL